MRRQKQNVSQSVMDQIKHGDVAMRPRRYFVLLTIASIAAIVFAAILIVYLSSIIFFWLRIQTAGTMAWGARANLASAVDNFPWWALIGSVLLVGLIVWMIKKQGRMYRYRTSLVVLAIVGIVIVAGLSLSYLGHGKMESPRQQNNSDLRRGPGWRQQNY